MFTVDHFKCVWMLWLRACGGSCPLQRRSQRNVEMLPVALFLSCFTLCLRVCVCVFERVCFDTVVLCQWHGSERLLCLFSRMNLLVRCLPKFTVLYKKGVSVFWGCICLPFAASPSTWLVHITSQTLSSLKVTVLFQHGLSNIVRTQWTAVFLSVMLRSTVSLYFPLLPLCESILEYLFLPLHGPNVHSFSVCFFPPFSFC